jgi:hypothetical protein
MLTSPPRMKKEGTERPSDLPAVTQQEVEDTVCVRASLQGLWCADEARCLFLPT